MNSAGGVSFTAHQVRGARTRHCHAFERRHRRETRGQRCVVGTTFYVGVGPLLPKGGGVRLPLLRGVSHSSHNHSTSTGNVPYPTPLVSTSRHPCATLKGNCTGILQPPLNWGLGDAWFVGFFLVFTRGMQDDARYIAPEFSYT